MTDRQSEQHEQFMEDRYARQKISEVEKTVSHLDSSMTRLAQHVDTFTEKVWTRFDKLNHQIDSKFDVLTTQLQTMQVERAAHAPTNWWKVIGAAAGVFGVLAILGAFFTAWGNVLVSPIRTEIVGQRQINENVRERLRRLEIRMERVAPPSSQTRIRIE